MKLIRKVRRACFLTSLTALVFCSFIPQKDKHYVDYFLNLYAANVFKKDRFTLDSMRVSYTWKTIDRVHMSFSCMRSLTKNDARKLIISMANDIIKQINNDPFLIDKGLLPDGHFCIDKLTLELHASNIFSENDSVGAIKKTILDHGNITYTTFLVTPLFNTGTKVYQETYRNASLLAEKEIRKTAGAIMDANRDAAIQKAKEAHNQVKKVVVEHPIERYNALTGKRALTVRGVPVEAMNTIGGKPPFGKPLPEGTPPLMVSKTERVMPETEIDEQMPPPFALGYSHARYNAFLDALDSTDAFIPVDASLYVQMLPLNKKPFFLLFDIQPKMPSKRVEKEPPFVEAPAAQEVAPPYTLQPQMMESIGSLYNPNRMKAAEELAESIYTVRYPASMFIAQDEPGQNQFPNQYSNELLPVPIEVQEEQKQIPPGEWLPVPPPNQGEPLTEEQFNEQNQMRLQQFKESQLGNQAERAAYPNQYSTNPNPYQGQYPNEYPQGYQHLPQRRNQHEYQNQNGQYYPEQPTHPNLGSQPYQGGYPHQGQYPNTQPGNVNGPGQNVPYPNQPNSVVGDSQEEEIPEHGEALGFLAEDITDAALLHDQEKIVGDEETSSEPAGAEPVDESIDEQPENKMALGFLAEDISDVSALKDQGHDIDVRQDQDEDAKEEQPAQEEPQKPAQKQPEQHQAQAEETPSQAVQRPQDTVQEKQAEDAIDKSVKLEQASQVNEQKQDVEQQAAKLVDMLIQAEQTLADAQAPAHAETEQKAVEDELTVQNGDHAELIPEENNAPSMDAPDRTENQIFEEPETAAAPSFQQEQKENNQTLKTVPYQDADQKELIPETSSPNVEDESDRTEDQIFEHPRTGNGDVALEDHFSAYESSLLQSQDDDLIAQDKDKPLPKASADGAEKRDEQDNDEDEQDDAKEIEDPVHSSIERFIANEPIADFLDTPQYLDAEEEAEQETEK